MNICLQNPEVAANEESAQEHKNMLKKVDHANVLTGIWPFEDPTILCFKHSLSHFFKSLILAKKKKDKRSTQAGLNLDPGRYDCSSSAGSSKSKFGPRHAVKLIELYRMMKSKF
jgi:hypothetical protein